MELFRTERLSVRVATPADADLFLALWHDPRVMTNVGFPGGMPIRRESIVLRLERESTGALDQLLVAELRATGEAIGECFLHAPNEAGIASTDVKLKPEHWGRRFGVELKQGLLGYLFAHTDCVAVEATPNVGNVASIRMQEAVGGERVGENTWTPPPEAGDGMAPVHHYVYRVTRDLWQSRREEP